MEKAKLLGPRHDTPHGMPEDTVEVPGMGPVRVRGLNRVEAMFVQGAKGAEATERRILACGMVDPELTEAEAGQWQKVSTAGEIEAVSTRIAELSGMTVEAAKTAYKSDGSGSESGV